MIGAEDLDLVQSPTTPPEIFSDPQGDDSGNSDSLSSDAVEPTDFASLSLHNQVEYLLNFEL
jgi:hypothetical protein